MLIFFLVRTLVPTSRDKPSPVLYLASTLVLVISRENPSPGSDLVEEFADVIELQLLAHHHTDSFKAAS